MSRKCLDAGLIQAFLDGELADEALEATARHFSACADCAALLKETEAEFEFLSVALAPELNAPVPTESLRARIEAGVAAINAEQSRPGFYEKAAAWFALPNGFSMPMMGAAAGLLLMVGVIGVLLSSSSVGEMVLSYTPVSIPAVEKTIELNKDKAELIIPEVAAADLTGGQLPSAKPGLISSKKSAAPTFKVEKAVYQAAERSQRKAAGVVKNRAGAKPVIEPQFLEGEGRYLQTIDTLSRSVETRKDEFMRASAQVSYKRDLAVVDDAITKMQKVARKNPKDEAVKQMLFASYQNKIDLLSSVSQKTDLVASLY
jgi:hypothetical protein